MQLKKYAMTAKEIIIKLVDENKLSGEEAFILIEAISKQIIYQPYEIKTYPYTYPYTYTISDQTNTITADKSSKVCTY